MNLTHRLLTIGIGFGLGLVGFCADLGDTSKLPPPAKETGLTYGKHIAPIVEKSCLDCHGPQKPKSKYRVDNRDSLIKGGNSNKAAIVPGQSAKSPIVHYVSDLVRKMEMPPLNKREKYSKLTPEQVGLLRAWIDQGAK
jgi:hypothetical protein